MQRSFPTLALVNVIGCLMSIEGSAQVDGRSDRTRIDK
jgi:hypothetical protein